MIRLHEIYLVFIFVVLSSGTLFAGDSISYSPHGSISVSFGTYEIFNTKIGLRVKDEFYVDVGYGFTIANTQTGQLFYFHDSYYNVGFRYRFIFDGYAPIISMDVGKVLLQGTALSENGVPLPKNDSYLVSFLTGCDYIITKSESAEVDLLLRVGVRQSKILHQGKKITPTFQTGFQICL